MAGADDSSPPKDTHSLPPTAPPATVDIERGTEARGGGGTEAGTGAEAGTGVSNIVRRCRREDLVKRGALVARGIALVFSFLAFILTASNKHGDWMNFDEYEEFRYLLAIAILSTLYTGLQSAKQCYELFTARQIINWKHMAVVDFVGDQIVAYLLISAGSATVPVTDAFRELENNRFTGTSASAVAMDLLAFFALAVSAIISGYKISAHLYI